MRFIARVATVLGVLVAVVITALALLLHNEAFSRWAVELIAARSGGVVQVESVSGTLADRLRIESVVVTADAGTAVAQVVEIAIDPRSLIARSAILDSLVVQRLHVELAEEPSSSGTIEPTDLSLLVLIDDLRIGEIELVASESSYSVADVSLALRLMRNRLELEDVRARYESLAVTADAQLTLSRVVAIRAQACATGEFAGETVDGCIQTLGDSELLRLDAQLRAPFTAVGDGTVAPAADMPIDIELAWEDAQFAALEDVTSPRGSATLTGTLRAPRVAAAGDVVWLDESAQFAVNASMDETGVAFDSLELVHDDGSLQARGAVSAALDSGELDVSFRDVAVQHWVADLPGSLDGSANLEFAVQPDLRLRASDVVARGELRGFPVTAVGAFGYDEAGISIESLQAVSRTDRVDVSGRLGASLDLDIDASIADLAIVSDELSGALTADLRIGGTAERPLIRGGVDLTDFASARFAAEQLQIAGSAGLEPNDPLSVAATASGVHSAGAELGTLTLDLTGSAAAHRIELQMGAANWSSRLIGNGALADRDWSGRIVELEFVPDELGSWRLTLPADVRYGAGGYSVSRLCLTYDISSFCGAVSVAGTPEDLLEVEAVNFDIGIVEPFMPDGLRAKGLVSANGRLSNFVEDPRGRIQVQANDAQVDILLADDLAVPIPVAEFALAALLDDAGATLSARLDAAESGRASAAVVVEDPRNEDSPVRGTVNLVWEDAAVLSALSPDVDGLAGRVDMRLAVGGTLSEPALDGAATWSGGALEVPAWGLVVEQIVASVEATQRRDAVFSATGMIDAQPVEIDGSVLLDPEQGWPMNLQLRGENLSLVQLADIEMNVTPNLQAQVRLPQINVSGNVGIPYARIRDVVLPEQAVAPSADAVVHGLEDEVRARPLDLIADLNLALGDDVTYEDENLTAAVTGGLNLDYRSGQGATAQGALTLAGQYDAYGTPLALERGQLIFVGPLIDPSLDILAVREVGEVRAGVQLTGTLRRPTTTIFSEPAMSEADALGWLLFGRPLDGSREADSAALRSAALSMGLQQALPVIERIGETLRLDDFAIRTTETDAGALMAGKYLSPNLYFRYSYGLFNRIGGLLLRYRINDRFSLETRSGENNSMDLLYTLEKD